MTVFRMIMIIVKLEAYGFHIDALKFIHNSLSNRKQKVNDAYSSWKDIFYVAPQGSILSPLLFNTHLCDLSYSIFNLYSISISKSQSLVH